jgi:hypothetical protein
MTVLAVLGVAFTKLLLTEGRFSDQQNAARGARSVARQSMNVLLSELRMVQDSGFIDSATTDGKLIRVKVPYWFGLNCGNVGGKTVASMLPVDSLMVAQAKYYGWAWRSANGRYYQLTGGGAVTSTSPTKCTSSTGTNAGIKAVTVAGRTGQMLDLTPQPPASAPGPAPQGEAVFLYQRVTYSFKASTAFPGKQGLWRLAEGGTDEELVAPFDTTARFKYWKVGASTSIAAPPALLDSIRGFDVVLAGISTYTPTGKSKPVTSTIVTSIFFKNMRAF